MDNIKYTKEKKNLIIGAVLSTITGAILGALTCIKNIETLKEFIQ
jgi:hypothetical protein|tara:strand:- start:735 stop:869 length:135 start_codon:yes stop_codon:yes gene_type:complete